MLPFVGTCSGFIPNGAADSLGCSGKPSPFDSTSAHQHRSCESDFQFVVGSLLILSPEVQSGRPMSGLRQGAWEPPEGLRVLVLPLGGLLPQSLSEMDSGGIMIHFVAI